MNDDALVDQFRRARSEAAFRLLYRRHGGRLFSLCARLLGSSGTQAEDAAQESWVRAIAAIDRFEGRSTFATWLSGIAINVTREAVRRGVLQAAAVAPTESSVDPKPHLTIDLADAVAQLAPGHREIFILHDLEGFTHDEIATILSLAPGTAKSQLSRARSRLRQLIGPTPLSGE